MTLIYLCGWKNVDFFFFLEVPLFGENKRNSHCWTKEDCRKEFKNTRQEVSSSRVITVPSWPLSAYYIYATLASPYTRDSEDASLCCVLYTRATFYREDCVLVFASITSENGTLRFPTWGSKSRIDQKSIRKKKEGERACRGHCDRSSATSVYRARAFCELFRERKNFYRCVTGAANKLIRY